MTQRLEQKFTITVDLKKNIAIASQTPQFISNDTNILYIRVLDDGKAFDYQNVERAVINLKRKDGTVVNALGEYDALTDMIKYTVGSTETEIEGNLDANISLFLGSTRVTSKNFTIKVKKDFEEGIPSEEGFSVLQQLFIEVEQKKNATEIATQYANEAAEYAIGIRENLKHLGEYNPTLTYKESNIVSYGGITYIALSNVSVGITPLNGTYWSVLSSSVTNNEQTWVAGVNQKTFTLTNGKYVVGKGNIQVTVGGVPQVSGVNFTESSETTISFSEAVPTGTTVYAKWFEGAISITKGHRSVHEAGGQDELDVTKLYNYTEKVANKFSQVEGQLAEKATKDELISKKGTSTYDKVLNKQVVKIVCKGDSLTYSVTTGTTQVANPYPKLLQDKLNYIYDHSNVTVVNSGVPGDTTTMGLTSFKTGVLDHNPNMCIIMYGLNDGYKGLDINNYKSDLVNMIQQCKKNNIEVLLCSPTPMMKNDNVNNTNARWDISIYVKACQEVAESEKVDFLNLFEEFNSLYAENGINSGIFSDKIHLTDKGYKLIADIIIKEKFSYTFTKEIVEGGFLHFDSPYVMSTVSQVYAGTQKLGNNLFMQQSKPAEVLKFLYYAKKPIANLFLLNYQASTISNAIKLKNFGLDYQTLNCQNTTATYDVETKINIDDVGLYCFTVTGADALTGFAPSGLYKKPANSTIETKISTPTLLNSWVSFSDTFSEPKVIKEGNKVTLQGVVKSGSTGYGVAIFTLPSDCIPSKIRLLSTSTSVDGVTNSLCTIEVRQAGNVVCGNGVKNNYLSLDGLSYYI